MTQAHEPALADGKQRRRTRPWKAQQERLIKVAARGMDTALVAQGV